MSKEIENKNKREVDMMKYMFKITRKDSGAHSTQDYDFV